MRILSITLVLLACAVVGCQEADEHDDHGHAYDPGSRQVVAEVGEARITRSDLDRRILMLPEPAQARLVEPSVQLDFLNRLVDELLLVEASEDLGLDREPEFTSVLEDARRQLLAEYYYTHVMRARAVPDSATIERYYEEHPEQFTISERVTGRQIVVETEAEAQEIRVLLEAGTEFETLLGRSTDQQTRALRGSIGIVSRGNPVRSLGNADDFVEALMQYEAGDVTQPIRTSLGYHVVELESHDAETRRPLVLVRESLARRVETERIRELTRTTLDSLRAAKSVKVHDDVVLGGAEVDPERAEELFARAQSTEDPRERLDVYDSIVSEFAGSKHAVQAQFMRGFILIEELDETDKGTQELERLIREHPDSELVDSARWMLDNMNEK